MAKRVHLDPQCQYRKFNNILINPNFRTKSNASKLFSRSTPTVLAWSKPSISTPPCSGSLVWALEVHLVLRKLTASNSKTLRSRRSSCAPFWAASYVRVSTSSLHITLKCGSARTSFLSTSLDMQHLISCVRLYV
jgi:hypothetical protein